MVKKEKSSKKDLQVKEKKEKVDKKADSKVDSKVAALIIEDAVVPVPESKKKEKSKKKDKEGHEKGEKKKSASEKKKSKDSDEKEKSSVETKKSSVETKKSAVEKKKSAVETKKSAVETKKSNDFEESPKVKKSKSIEGKVLKEKKAKKDESKKEPLATTNNEEDDFKVSLAPKKSNFLAEGKPSTGNRWERNNNNNGARQQDRSNEYTIWVGNLPYESNEVSLREFFSDCGEIIRVHCPFYEGRNKGFAHVQFTSAAARDAAIAKSESQLDGRNLLIKDANDYKRTGNAPRVAKRGRENDDGANNNEPSATLFLKNLAFSCPEEEIRSHFGQYGEVVSVRIPMIPGTDRRKGFGYVEFNDKESALKAMEVGTKLTLSGRDCFLEFAAEKKSRY